MPFEEEQQSLSAVSASVTSSCLHLIALWTAAGLDCYDTQAWLHPEVHASASDDIMEGALPCLRTVHMATAGPARIGWQ